MAGDERVGTPEPVDRSRPAGGVPSPWPPVSGYFGSAGNDDRNNDRRVSLPVISAEGAVVDPGGVQEGNDGA